MTDLSVLTTLDSSIKAAMAEMNDRIALNFFAPNPLLQYYVGRAITPLDGGTHTQQVLIYKPWNGDQDA
jgi:hypothetical protein